MALNIRGTRWGIYLYGYIKFRVLGVLHHVGGKVMHRGNNVVVIMSGFSALYMCTLLLLLLLLLFILLLLLLYYH